MADASSPMGTNPIHKYKGTSKFYVEQFLSNFNSNIIYDVINKEKQ